ncbi:MAG TPA: sigma-70 family RNA polymerase sigma factor [Terriglobales bacterium]|nr:sigma-70 family RNA polymerase sigma factor [Terriglobales bacterium]
MAGMAGAANLGELAGAIGIRAQESALIQELKAGSEDAYAWLIGEFHQPVYSLVYRILTDPADAADTAQEVFLKIFRGMKHFHGESSLKTWIYRIAIHEASNRRRWWFRHKSKETPVEQNEGGSDRYTFADANSALIDQHKSPFEMVADHEIQARVECELRNVPEPYRTAVVLRDIEDLSYDEIAEITQVSLGTVKSRITRGRDALRKLLSEYAKEVGPELGFSNNEPSRAIGAGRKRIEVMP